MENNNVFASTGEPELSADEELKEMEITIQKLESEHEQVFTEFKSIIGSCSKKALARLLFGLHQMETKPIKCQSQVEEAMFKISNTLRGTMQHALMIRTYRNQLREKKEQKEKKEAQNEDGVKTG